MTENVWTSSFSKGLDTGDFLRYSVDRRQCRAPRCLLGPGGVRTNLSLLLGSLRFSVRIRKLSLTGLTIAGSRRGPIRLCVSISVPLRILSSSVSRLAMGLTRRITMPLCRGRFEFSQAHPTSTHCRTRKRNVLFSARLTYLLPSFLIVSLKLYWYL